MCLLESGVYVIRSMCLQVSLSVAVFLPSSESPPPPLFAREVVPETWEINSALSEIGKFSLSYRVLTNTCSKYSI